MGPTTRPTSPWPYKCYKNHPADSHVGTGNERPWRPDRPKYYAHYDTIAAAAAAMQANALTVKSLDTNHPICSILGEINQPDSTAVANIVANVCTAIDVWGANIYNPAATSSTCSSRSGPPSPANRCSSPSSAPTPSAPHRGGLRSARKISRCRLRAWPRQHGPGLSALDPVVVARSNSVTRSGSPPPVPPPCKRRTASRRPGTRTRTQTASPTRNGSARSGWIACGAKPTSPTPRTHQQKDHQPDGQPRLRAGAGRHEPHSHAHDREQGHGAT